MPGLWTDEERMLLLISIVDTHLDGSIKWDQVNIPEGRTIKSCTHVIQKLRDLAKKEAAKDSGQPKPEAAPRKRRNKADIEADGNDDGKPLKKAKTAVAKKKTKLAQADEDLDVEVKPEPNADDE